MNNNRLHYILFTFYNFFIWSVTPFIFFYLLTRIIKGKEDWRGLREKLGIISCDKKPGNYIWIHVASVGEAISSFQFIKNLLLKEDSINILITSVTYSSGQLISKHFKDSNSITHQYVPIDHEFIIKRFLKFWQPKLAIFFESELWPNLIRFTEKACPLLLINARMSDKSYAKWLKFKSFTPHLLGKFQFIFPQSQIDYKKYQSLGANHLKYIGNLKLANEVKVTQLEDQLLESIKGKVIILAASTHEGEEKEMIAMFNILKKQYSDLLLILVPRHPSRVPDIVMFLDSNNNKYNIRTTNNYPLNDIYIVDTIGELLKFYAISNIVFIGGSMVNIGGHNPLEAAKLGKFVYVGPQTHNFTEIVSKLTDLNILKTVNNWAELREEIEAKLNNSINLAENSNLINILNAEGERIINEYLKEVQKYL